jgi:hypothetical protein
MNNSREAPLAPCPRDSVCLLYRRVDMRNLKAREITATFDRRQGKNQP